jgi:SAM-dependent methyltransferase
MPVATGKIKRELCRIGRQFGLIEPTPNRIAKDFDAQPTQASASARTKPRLQDDPAFLSRKKHKLDRIRSLLQDGSDFHEAEHFFDFLTAELRAEFNIVDTENVSSHDYDHDALHIIEDYTDGIILDCGAGLRKTYYDNVVNFEICSYATTDVRGVGERLPFRDGVFDAVFSFNVLEHVKDPFACAREISRVLKKGGRLYCVVPFLQPFHGYPHHYYNMTHMGLRNLFSDTLEIDRQDVGGGGLPIFTLTWIIQEWLNGLPPKTRLQMERMKVADFNTSPLELLNRPFVTQLSSEKTLQLASTTALYATKRAGD